MTTEDLQTLAARAVRRLAGSIPQGQTLEDAHQDAALFILEAGDRPEGHLVMYAWGRLKDKYARLFKHNASTEYCSRVQAQMATHRETDENEPQLLRGARGRHATATTTAEARESPAPDLDAAIDIGAAIDRLPSEQAAVFRLVCVEGVSQAEAGRRLAISQTTVSNWLRAAKAALAVDLKGYCQGYCQKN